MERCFKFHEYNIKSKRSSSLDSQKKLNKNDYLSKFVNSSGKKFTSSNGIFASPVIYFTEEEQTTKNFVDLVRKFEFLIELLETIHDKINNIYKVTIKLNSSKDEAIQKLSKILGKITYRFKPNPNLKELKSKVNSTTTICKTIYYDNYTVTKSLNDHNFVSETMVDQCPNLNNVNIRIEIMKIFLAKERYLGLIEECFTQKIRLNNLNKLKKREEKLNKKFNFIQDQYEGKIVKLKKEISEIKESLISKENSNIPLIKHVQIIQHLNNDFFNKKLQILQKIIYLNNFLPKGKNKDYGTYQVCDTVISNIDPNMAYGTGAESLKNQTIGRPIENNIIYLDSEDI